MRDRVNMPHCRMENTAAALRECLDAFVSRVPMGQMERAKAGTLLRLCESVANDRNAWLGWLAECEESDAG